MRRTVQDIATFVGGLLKGDGQQVIASVADLKRAGPGDLAYADKQHLDRVPLSHATCVLVPGGEFPGRTVIIASDPKLAFVRAVHWLVPRKPVTRGVHPTASIAEDTDIGQGTAIGPWVVVEPGARIGDDTTLGAGCYIGRSSKVGRECTLYPKVTIYNDVVIRDRVIIHAGAVIGADGFGYVYDGARHIKFPQLGSVIIEDNVEIGANTSIDRGSLDNTVLEEGTKIDNLCQIAHNVRIGKHTVVAAQTGISGSSTVGSHAVIGGQVGIADHCRIDSDVTIGAQCGVPSRKRIRAGRVFWGTPARPLDDIKTQQAHVSRLPALAAEVARLGQRLDELARRLQMAE